MMTRLTSYALSALLALAPLASLAAEPPAQTFMGAMQWRSIGPSIGGRVVAVAGVPSEPNLFYMGGVQGGVWKSTDYGLRWENITDGKIPAIATSIGALAVAPSRPAVIYAGTGESDVRQDVDTGDGIYATDDAGEHWHYAGLRETHSTMDLAVDPRDPKVVYAASMGHLFVPGADRGIYKTTDGGKTWKKMLFVDDRTGGVYVKIDARHPNTIYASMWQAYRTPWTMESGGPGSALYKSTDGGEHWKKISANPGFARELLGKIGIAVSPADSRVVYALVQARDGGVFRSNDGGATWKRVNDEMKLRQRAFYYTNVIADPREVNTAYAPEVDSVFKTTDGGVTWNSMRGVPHGDNHTIWVNALHPKIMLEGNDGGATVTTDGGKTWSTVHNQPTGQFYKVALDGEFPFHVYGPQQDEAPVEGPSATIDGSIGLGDWHAVAGGESTWVAPEPGDPAVTYGAGYYSSMFRFDGVTGENKAVSPYPRYMSGASASETEYRFMWTHPILFSAADPNELLVGAQVVFSSGDRGKTWKAISPDLTRNDKHTEGPSGGPVFWDQTGAETYPGVESLAASPLDKDELWAGSADGLVHVTTDHGATWKDVTPPALPQWCEITTIEPSHRAKGTAYLSASRYMWDDFRPFVYKTTDFGAHWTPLVSGIPSNEYVFAVREDPREPRVLVAGTRSTVYVSVNAGESWQPLTLNLPGVQVRDLAFNAREGELVAATHGRSFWILDNVALLEDLARASSLATSSAQLFAPETAWLTHAYGGGGYGVDGENPDYGARVFFYVPKNYNGKTLAFLRFKDASGTVIRTFALHVRPKNEHEPSERRQSGLDENQRQALALSQLTAIDPGTNEFTWDLRYPPVEEVNGWRAMFTDDFPETSDGPTIVPGTYTVELSYGGTTQSQSFAVALDPRLHPAEGDLEARFALEMKLQGAIVQLNHAISAAMAARPHLSADKKRALDGELSELISFEFAASESDTMVPVKIRGQLGYLMQSIELAFQRPTAAEYATADQLIGLAADGAAKLKAIAGQ